jgi:hypothetical protein
MKKPFGQTKVGRFIKKTGIVGKALDAGSKLLGSAVGSYAGAPAGSLAEQGGQLLAQKAKQAGWGIHTAGLPMRGSGSAKVRKNKIIGSRRQVWHGTMQKTSGGLTKSDLMLNKRGRIVSKKKHAFGATKGRKFLVNAGYDPKKGSFKLFPKKR